MSSVRSTSDGRGPVTRKRVPDREEQGKPGKDARRGRCHPLEAGFWPLCRMQAEAMEDLQKRIAGMDVKDDDGPTFGSTVRVQMTTFAKDGPTFGVGAHNVHRALNGENVTDFTGQDVIEYFDKLLAESDKTPTLAAAMAHDMAAHAPANGAALTIAVGSAAAPVKEQKKKRKPKFSPDKYEATTTEEEKDDDDIPPPPPAPVPLEGLRSQTDPFTLTELEDMHKKIMQKCTPIIDEFSTLNIFEVSYVEQKLKEIKNAFKKDYDRNNQYVKFFKKVNKQGKTEVNDDVKGGSKGGSKGRKKK
jgi:hypothetical protein